MLNDNTIGKLHEMHLLVMAQAFRDQMKNGSFFEMPFEAEAYVQKNGRPEIPDGYFCGRFPSAFFRILHIICI